MGSFDNKKQIRFLITLGSGEFDKKGANQVTLEGYRSSVSCENAGWLQMGTLKAKIFGMSESDMRTITSYPFNIATDKQNTIVVSAIDGESESIFFAGNIVKAWPDFGSMPDVGFIIQAQSAMSAAIKSVSPRSFKSGCDVSDIMRQIATSMGFLFEDAGVNVKLHDVYLPNTELEQARELAKISGIEFTIDRNIFAIWPNGSHRNAMIPLVSKDTGLCGYPNFDGTFITFTTLYNKNIIPGGLIKVESGNINSSGQWKVLSLSHAMDSEKPGGSWFSNVRCVALDYYGK